MVSTRPINRLNDWLTGENPVTGSLRGNLIATQWLYRFLAFRTRITFHTSDFSKRRWEHEDAAIYTAARFTSTTHHN